MIRSKLAMLGLVMALAAQPALAENRTQSKAQTQDSSAAAAPEDATMARLAQLYPVEPLTAEQQARLPAARAVVDKMLPPGAMQKVIDSMFKRILHPLLQTEMSDPKADIARRLGVSQDKLSLDPQQTQEVASLLDPAWQQRSEALSGVMRQTMQQMMSRLEPSMRQAMSEIYAVHFDNKQLADLDAFFSTPTGTAYATEMMTISSDPRMIGLIMRDLPTIMGSFKDIDQRITAATANLPAPRSYDQLSAAQRTRLATLTGMSQEQLRSALTEDSAAGN